MMQQSRCRGPVSRRDFLRVGAASLGVLGAPAFTSARAPANDRSVILFWMWGGPSQLETFDPKPAAPSEYRGPFRPTRTCVPGMDVCELFPALARLGRRLTLVRSLSHTMSAHNDGSIEVLTGKTPSKPDPSSMAVSEHPDFGMVVSKVRGPRGAGVPPYVGVPACPFMTQPAYLGLGHKGFAAGDPTVPDYAPPDLRLAGGATGRQLSERVSLLGRLDAFRRENDARGRLEGHDRLRTSAVELLTRPKVAEAFAIGREHPRLRDRYGRHRWGQSCLLARRLAEAGAGVVVVDAAGPRGDYPIYWSWDDHANPANGWDLAKAMKFRAGYMDQALSALIEDVYDRGLDEQVLIVAVGEFGRTPRVTAGGGCTGRDHWPGAYCALLSGGGMPTGQVVGRTNARAEHPIERPLSPQDLLATVYHHLGIDPAEDLYDATGRPIPVLSQGRPIKELV